MRNRGVKGYTVSCIVFVKQEVCLTDSLASQQKEDYN